MSFSNIKFIYFFQLVAVFLTALGVLPPETSLILTAILVGYGLINPVEDSLLLAVASIPLYVALPFTDNFDSMANWRIIIFSLFCKWLASGADISLKNIHRRICLVFSGIIARSAPENKFAEDERSESQEAKRAFLKRHIRAGQDTTLYFILSTFCIFAILPLIFASYPLVGIKKLIFLANIFLLFILVKNIANTEEKIISLMKAVGLSAAITLIVGYLQFASVFFYSLYEFWQYWAQNIITVFYGHNLGELLSVSNTWFSYYQDLPPTLRIFSVFPDSHSFALYIVITLPILMTMLIYKAVFFQNLRNNSLFQKRSLRFLRLRSLVLGEFVFRCAPRDYTRKHQANSPVDVLQKGIVAKMLIIAISLIPIIFSGSRGVWVSALAAIAAGIFYSIKVSKKFRPAVFTIILLFALFPVSSFILGKSQEAELRRINSADATIERRSVSFERFVSVIDADETSNKGRLEIWRDTLNSIKGNLFFGVGFGNFPIILAQDVSAAKKGSSAHNIYLDILAEIGIFGLAAFALIFYEIAKTAYKVSKSENKIFSFFSSIFFIYLFWITAYGLFDVVLFNDKALLAFMATIGILYSIKSLEIRN